VGLAVKRTHKERARIQDEARLVHQFYLERKKQEIRKAQRTVEKAAEKDPFNDIVQKYVPTIESAAALLEGYATTTGLHYSNMNGEARNTASELRRMCALSKFIVSDDARRPALEVVPSSERKAIDRAAQITDEERERSERHQRYVEFARQEKSLVEVLTAHGIDAEHIDESSGPPKADIRINRGSAAPWLIEVKTRKEPVFKNHYLTGLWPYRVMKKSAMVSPKPDFVACVSAKVFPLDGDPLHREGYFFAETNSLKLAEHYGDLWYLVDQRDTFGIEELKDLLR